MKNLIYLKYLIFILMEKFTALENERCIEIKQRKKKSINDKITMMWRVKFKWKILKIFHKVVQDN